MREDNTYDIAVIGGGLAGLCLAIQSADAGYSVLLFEKEQYPFHKVCGEYISFESWNFLKRLDVPLEEWRLPLIKQLNISDASGKLYKFNLPLGGFGVSRYKLDDALYQIAEEKNVHVFTNARVQDVTYNKGQFNIISAAGKFRALIAAGSYGKRSNLDIKWNRSFIQQKTNKLNNYIGIKYHIQYPQPDNVIALHNFENGYCGISKIEGDKCCLCYLTAAANLQKNNNSIQQMEQTVLYKNPRLKEIFSEANFLYDKPLTISQISFAKKSQVEDHVLMVGDAAGMITPLCGNGMSMAMHGSKIAFENINAFLKAGVNFSEMQHNYKKQWQQKFAKRLWMGRTVQRFFGGNASTKMFFKIMHHLPVLARQVIKSTHGKPF